MRAIMPEGRTPGGGAKNSARRADVTTLANCVRDFEGLAQSLPTMAERGVCSGPLPPGAIALYELFGLEMQRDEQFTMKIADFKRELRSSLERICAQKRWNFDNAKQRG